MPLGAALMESAVIRFGPVRSTVMVAAPLVEAASVELPWNTSSYLRVTFGRTVNVTAPVLLVSLTRISRHRCRRSLYLVELDHLAAA